MKQVNGAAKSPKHQILEEKDLKTLYNYATVKRLQSGDKLFNEGDSDQGVHLFIEGALSAKKRLNGKDKEFIQIRQERGNGGIAFFGQDHWPVSISAVEPSMLLTFKESTFEALDDRLKLYFYKRQHRIDFEMVGRLLKKEVELIRKNQYYETYLFSTCNRTRPDYSQSELITGILKKIPKLPVFAATLASDLTDEEVSSTKVSDKVKQDPSLTANVLKTINSSYYSFGRKISDINHAVMLLGFNELYQLVIDEGVQRVMPNSSAFREILSHSNCVSRIAFGLSLSSHAGKPSEISTIGLLHDLGKSIQHLLKRQNPKLNLLIEGLEPSLIGGILLRDWNLPKQVWQSIEYQEYPKFAPPSEVPEDLLPNVALLYVAHLCFDTFSGKTNGMKSPFQREYIKVLDFGNTSIEKITKQCVIPTLIKNMDSFPAFFRKYLTTYMRSHMST